MPRFARWNCRPHVIDNVFSAADRFAFAASQDRQRTDEEGVGETSGQAAGSDITAGVQLPPAGSAEETGRLFTRADIDPQFRRPFETPRNFDPDVIADTLVFLAAGAAIAFSHARLSLSRSAHRRQRRVVSVSGARR